MYSAIDVGEGSYILVVYDDLNFLCGYFSFLDVLLHMLIRFLGTRIINVSNMIVTVVLHEDRIEVAQIKAVFYIIVTCNDNTKRQFFSLLVKVNIIFLIKILSVLLKQFLYPLLFLLFGCLKLGQLYCHLSSKFYTMDYFCHLNCPNVHFFSASLVNKILLSSVRTEI